MNASAAVRSYTTPLLCVPHDKRSKTVWMYYAAQDCYI